MFIFDKLEPISSYHLIKMNIKTKLFEDYLNFVEKTKKQNTYFEILIVLIGIDISLFSIFFLLENFNE